MKRMRGERISFSKRRARGCAKGERTGNLWGREGGRGREEEGEVMGENLMMGLLVCLCLARVEY
jgi:hypothetical protein